MLKIRPEMPQGWMSHSQAIYGWIYTTNAHNAPRTGRTTARLRNTEKWPSRQYAPSDPGRHALPDFYWLFPWIHQPWMKDS